MDTANILLCSARAAAKAPVKRASGRKIKTKPCVFCALRHCIANGRGIRVIESEDEDDADDAEEDQDNVADSDADPGEEGKDEDEEYVTLSL